MSTVHVVPVNDLIDHPDEDCVSCKARVNPNEESQ